MKTVAVLGGGSAGFDGGTDRLQKRRARAVFAGRERRQQQGGLAVCPKQPNDFLSQVVPWKDNEIAQFRAHRRKEIRDLASDSFESIRSNATFVNEHELVSEGERHRFDAAIIATGSVTGLPKIDG